MTELCSAFEHALAPYLRGEVNLARVHDGLLTSWHLLRVHGHGPTRAASSLRSALRRAQRTAGVRLSDTERRTVLQPLATLLRRP